MAFRNGPMRTGGSYEEFAELLARFHLTFEPLKARGGDDAADFKRISTALARMARRHHVPVPPATLKEHAEIERFRTPFEAMDHLDAFIRDHGLCQEGVPYALHDSQDRNALGQSLLGVFHRYKALVARFDRKDGRPVAVGIDAWIGRAEYEPLERILDPQRKEEPCP